MPHTFTASQLLERHWDGNIPVDLYRLAKAVGVSVLECNFARQATVASFEYRNGLPVICLDKTEHPLRHRFALAHELGQFAAGEQSHVALRSSFNATTLTRSERRANAFALAVLMPADALEVVIRNHLPDTGIKGLAAIFEVSEVAMVTRLKELGYLRG